MTTMGNFPDSPTSQGRREALKTFGRYAAVAPTVMVLLEPRESYAGKGRGRGRGGSKGRKRRNGGSHY
jgi:hypothetical protein